VIDVTRGAAQWSLASLCERHPKLVEIKDGYYKTASEEERKVLDGIFKK
jgi:hypothetical protein